MNNIKLHISYDGTAYHGWQKQNNAATVQQTLEEAIRSVTGQLTEVTGCSRTDAGVHALDYVCNFFSETQIPAGKIPLALNSYLPRDIRVKAAEYESDGFNSRFSTTGKTYQYCIWNSHIADPFFDRYSYQVTGELDVVKMQAAAGHFIGTHDFSAFMAAGGQQKTTVRTVNELSVERKGDRVNIVINADAYLYNMVRIISGTLIYAGNGKTDPDEIPDIIKSCNRERAGITAPAKGLFLKQVFYPGREG